MVKTFILLFMLLIGIFPASAQQKLVLNNGCNFIGEVKPNTTFWVLDANADAKKIVDEILEAVGLEKNFKVKVGDVPNAQASLENSIRYIIFNIEFLETVKYDSRKKWAAYVVIAHEIGHHLNSHDLNLGSINHAACKQQELEADRFAGKVLNMLRVTKMDAHDAMAYNVDKLTETETHPAPALRIAAVDDGWETYQEWRRKHDPNFKQVEEVDLSKCAYCPHMIKVNKSTFQMGNKDGESDERPVHEVNLRPFYLAETEVTIAQFRSFVEETGYVTDGERNGNTVSFQEYGGQVKTSNMRRFNWRLNDNGKEHDRAQENFPVAYISWNDAVNYCEWLSLKTGRKFRLPTESEWEYAAKAGKTTRFSGGDDATEVGWIAENSNKNAHPSGSRKSNAFGFEDMTGNVREWCDDCYFINYNSAPKDGAQWKQNNCSFRVIRGGSWYDKSQKSTVTTRYNASPDSRNSYIGFRVAMN
jgi:formylglycine-generating enzyme required for sulfatase activity